MTEPRRYAGFAEEEDFNPDTAPEAVFHIDIGSATLDAPSDPNLQFEGGMSRGRKTIRPGFYSPSGNIVYPIDIRSIGYWLKWTLGLYKFTDGGVGANTHEIYPSEDIVLPSYTVRLGKDNFEHIFRGCVANGLEIKVEDDFVYATLDNIGARDSRGALKAVADLTLFTENQLSFVDTSLTLGASNYNCKIKGLTISITNGTDAKAGKGFGSRHPCRIPAGNRNIDIKGSLFFEDYSEYTKFWGAATGVDADGASTEEMVITIDAGTDGSIEFKIPKLMYTDLKTPPSGRGEIVQAFSALALIDTIELADGETDIEAEILVTLLNNNDDMDDDIMS